MTRIKTRLILGTVLGILGLGWAVLGAMPGFAAGVGNQCDGKWLFKMNIIGVPKGKNPPMNNTSRKTIFVKLSGQSDIFLTQGPFSVCDGNSWDQAYDCNGNPVGNFTGAVFQLPCDLLVPTDFECTSGEMACYDIYARALGTPGGQVTITTCGILSDGTRVCATTNPAIISRGYGKPTFKKVTNQLTTLQNVCVGTKCGSFSLFTPDFQYFLWQYDNMGLRNAMLVFCGAECP